ncbi:unnamed protein product [Nezara viridula]|uniref:Uncharacterized protein n=1 Tax=Nezara viridula TaxID=85310 RepID=A0A9P0H1Z6_NEZVI|nr:unnamed protein product [Nezara viridula]
MNQSHPFPLFPLQYYSLPGCSPAGLLHLLVPVCRRASSHPFVISWMSIHKLPGPCYIIPSDYMSGPGSLPDVRFFHNIWKVSLSSDPFIRFSIPSFYSEKISIYSSDGYPQFATSLLITYPSFTTICHDRKYCAQPKFSLDL